jgi:hypothetical protein
MKFSIDSIILWPKRDEFSYRRLPFADGKIKEALIKTSKSQAQTDEGNKNDQ